MAQVDQMEPAPTATDLERVGYLKWSCDRLAAALESETNARAASRTQAQMSFLLIPALVGVVLTSKEHTSQNMAVTALASLIVLAASSIALASWYRVMRVEAAPAVAPEVFIADEGTTAEYNYVQRLVRARDNFHVAVKLAQDQNRRLAGFRQRSLKATLAAVIAAAFPFVLDPIRILIEAIR